MPEECKADKTFPRLVHLTWKDENVPDYWQESVRNWHAFHPDWKIVLWTDVQLRELVAQYFPERLALYDSYPINIMRVDFARYCILQLFGGIYCDLDICPVTTFEPLLAFYDAYGADVVISESAVAHRGSQNLTNAFMISRPKAPFWDLVWQILQKPYKYGPWWKKPVGVSRHYKIIFETGPGVINEAVTEYRTRNPPRDVDSWTDVQVLPRQFVQHTPHWKKRPSQAPGNLAKLLQGGSWHRLDSKMATQADEAWEARDVWAVVLAAVFLTTTIILAVLLALCCKSRRCLQKQTST